MGLFHRAGQKHVSSHVATKKATVISFDRASVCVTVSLRLRIYLSRLWGYGTWEQLTQQVTWFPQLPTVP